jgi:hypothetical protein
MQILLRDSIGFCWNVTLIFLLTLLTAFAVTPRSSPVFLGIYYLAGLWSACFMYAILLWREPRHIGHSGAPPDQADAEFMKEAA